MNRQPLVLKPYLRLIQRVRCAFTLLEIIAVLLLFGIFAAVLVPFFGNAMHRSMEPATRFQAMVDVISVMERIIQDYESNTSDVASIKARIGAEGSAQDNAYGKYSVYRNRYIMFDASQNAVPDTTGANDKLLITLEDSYNQRTTILLAVQ